MFNSSHGQMKSKLPNILIQKQKMKKKKKRPRKWDKKTLGKYDALIRFFSLFFGLPCFNSNSWNQYEETRRKKIQTHQKDSLLLFGFNSFRSTIVCKLEWYFVFFSPFAVLTFYFIFVSSSHVDSPPKERRKKKPKSASLALSTLREIELECLNWIESDTFFPSGRLIKMEETPNEFPRQKMPKRPTTCIFPDWDWIWTLVTCTDTQSIDRYRCDTMKMTTTTTGFIDITFKREIGKNIVKRVRQSLYSSLIRSHKLPLFW